MHVLWIFLAFFLFFEPLHAAVKSQVVGKAGKYYFTSREVQISYALEQALILPKDRFEKTSLYLPMDSSNFKIELNGAFLEWVVAEEAVAFSVAKVDEKELKKAASVLQARLGGRRTWKTLGVSESEFQTFLLRKLRAKKFIQFKAESSVIEVSTDEAEDYYKRNRERFGSVPFFKFSPKIKAFLKKKKRDERLQSWFEVLQKKYDVRSFLIGKK